MPFEEAYYRKIAEAFSEQLIRSRDCTASLPPSFDRIRLLLLLSEILGGPLVYVSPTPTRLISVCEAVRENGLDACVLLCEDPYAADDELSRERGILCIEPELLSSHAAASFIRNYQPKAMLIEDAHRAFPPDPEFTYRMYYIPCAERYCSYRIPAVLLSDSAKFNEFGSLEETMLLSHGYRKHIRADFSRAVVRILRLGNEGERREAVMRLALEHETSPVLFCSSSHKEAEDYFLYLRSAGYSAVLCHGDMPARLAYTEIRKYANESVPFAVCTPDMLPALCERPPKSLIWFSMMSDLPSFSRGLLHALRGTDTVTATVLYVPEDVRARTLEVCSKISQGDDVIPDDASRNALLQTAVQYIKQSSAFCTDRRCLMPFLSVPVGGRMICNCGRCSSCEPTEEMADVTEDARILIKAAVMHRYPEKTMVAYLRGELNKPVDDRLYGCLSMRSRNYLSSLIRSMTEDRYLSIEQDRGRGPYLTSGRLSDHFHGNTAYYLPYTLREPLPNEAAAVLSEPCDPVLYASLVRLRRKLSSDNAVPTFRVIGNIALRALASRCPQTADELFSIPLLTREQVERYGPVFLKRIRKHLQKARDDSV